MTRMPSTYSADALLALVQQGLQVFDLGRPYVSGMPKSPNHAPYTHTLQRRHGDKVREDGGSAANDLIVLGTHVGTHVDALAHISHRGRLFGGHDAAIEQVGGRFLRGGAHEVGPWVCRGVLLDVAEARGAASCPAASPVTPADLDAAASRQGVEVHPGDVVLVRTGWGHFWDDHDRYVGTESGVPGPDTEAAQWFVDKGVRAVGSDTIAFEHIPAGVGHARLPVHRVLLVEHGINIIETLALEELARERVHEFLFVLAPLNLVGATGAPVRPLAVTTCTAA